MYVGAVYVEACVYVCSNADVYERVCKKAFAVYLCLMCMI